MTDKAMVDPLNTKAAAEAFAVWWNADGRFLDPDTSDVPWFDKREALAEYAYLAAASEAANLLSSQKGEIEGLTADRDGALRANQALDAAIDRCRTDASAAESRALSLEEALRNLAEAVDCEVDIGGKSGVFRKRLTEARAALKENGNG